MQQYSLAPLSARLGALLYDTLCLLAIFMLVTAIWVVATGDAIETPYREYLRLSLLFTTYIYYLFFWMRDAHTTGMRAWRLRIQQFNGEPITCRQATIRLLVAPISLLALGLGFFWMLISPTKRTWQDSLSKTEIVRIPKSDLTQPSTPIPSKK